MRHTLIAMGLGAASVGLAIQLLPDDALAATQVAILAAAGFGILAVLVHAVKGVRE